ncbi:MAG: virulence protein SciE type [Alphaproteobacteria bacterium]|nr:virulence protein SciE type [Alphaproteobacteria bacterium]
MPSPDELIRQGDVAGARAALIDEVRARPDDRRARMFLSQVLMVLGEWDKALTHMKAIANLSPEAMTLFTAYDRAIAAEKQREAVFAGKAAPQPLVEAAPWFADLLGAIAAEARGDAATAASLRTSAFDGAPDTPGEADGTAFTFLADADARFGPSLEVILDGRYGLVPFESVTELTCDGVTDLRDLVFLPARLTLRTGQAGNVFLPARYPGAAVDEDPLVKLARKTEWVDHGDLGNAGRGQHLLDADGAEISLLALRRLTFAA